MRITSFVVGLLITLSACTERMICPAYQSAFLHDKQALMAHFSYFNADSTPIIRDVDKSRFLLIEPVAYQKRVRDMRTVEMRDVIPVPVDSAALDNDLMLAERDIVDTLQTQKKDSIHPGLKGPFNTDQELYMYYLRDVLVLPDARESMSQENREIRKKDKEKKKLEGEEKTEKDAKDKKDAKEEKERTGPFSIFKKKDKEGEEGQEKDNEEIPDNEQEPPPAEDDGDGGDDF